MTALILAILAVLLLPSVPLVFLDSTSLALLVLLLALLVLAQSMECANAQLDTSIPISAWPHAQLDLAQSVDSALSVPLTVLLAQDQPPHAPAASTDTLLTVLLEFASWPPSVKLANISLNLPMPAPVFAPLAPSTMNLCALLPVFRDTRTTESAVVLL